MNGVSGKAAELGQKLDVLDRDLKYWSTLSVAGAKFEKHHSQVARVAAQLRSAKAVLSTDAAVAAAAGNLAPFRALQFDALDLHRVWEFFRSKLAQRLVPSSEQYLEAADQFAWELYSPVVDIAHATRREPPLTFFSTEPTPFAMWRDRSYQFAIGADLRRAETVAVVRQLPVPVIGMPWIQLAHVPDLLFLAHEVGHEVEEELKLGTAIGAAIAATIRDDVQRAGWRAWAGELFADVYGTLTAGPEFTRHLIGYALTGANVSEQVRTAQHWGTYPTPSLRVLVSLTVLRQSSFEADADDIERQWRAVVPSHRMLAYEDGVPALVTALLALPLPGGLDLRRFNPYKPVDEIGTSSGAASIIGDQALTVGTTRQAVAAAARAFRTDAAVYVAKDGHTRTLRQMLAIRAPGVLNDSSAAREAVEQHRRDDESSGSAVLAAIRRMRPDRDYEM